MESLREKLLVVIGGDLPVTPEVQKFCEDGGFTRMLNRVIKTIAKHITEDK